MLPHLQAEELLDAAQATALGTGALKPWDAARLSARLERIAAGGGKAPPASPQALAMMGIAVEVV